MTPVESLMAFEDIIGLIECWFRGAIKWIHSDLRGVMLIAQQFAGQWLVPYLGLIPEQVTTHYWVWQPFT